MAPPACTPSLLTNIVQLLMYIFHHYGNHYSLTTINDLIKYSQIAYRQNKQWHVVQQGTVRYTYKIDYTQEWVMRLCNPRVCGYPEAKPRDKCKQWVTAHNPRVGVVYLTYTTLRMRTISAA